MLDTVDQRLLRLVQQDGRISNANLARSANLSAAACHERMKRLQRDGYIAKFVALLNPVLLNRALLIFIEIVLDRTTAGIFAEFSTAVAARPEILECHMVAGGFDYLIKARVKDMDAYRVFLGETLMKLPGVRETHTYAVIEEVKNTVEIAI